MIIAKNDEAKRSKIWRMVTLVSSVLIIIIAIYFLMKMFTANPLVGKWKGEDAGFNLNIKKGNVVIAEIPDIAENTNVSVKMRYTIDMESKIIVIEEDSAEIDKVLENAKEAYTREDIENVLDDIRTSFDYSVEQEQLTLTEREYGEQLTFIRE